MSEMSSEVYDLLREPFDEAAYSADNSRGFELTSIKAAYVFERLNEVFGLCGQGWRYAHSPFEEIDNEVCTEIALQIEVESNGCGAVEWDAMIGHWRSTESDKRNLTWSAPIFSPGGKHILKGRLTDARKSAVTDGITKAASMIGVGSDVFKGLVQVGKQSQPQRRQQSSQPAQKARERAKSPKGQSEKMTRPMTPDQIKNGLQTRASEGSSAKTTARQAKFVARLFNEVWVDDVDGESKYHTCLNWLLGVESATDLTKGASSACSNYLRKEPDSDDNYDLHPAITEEMKAVLEVATA